MVDKDLKKIVEARQGLIQYIGAIMTNLEYKNEEARQIVCALLTEEALKVSTVDNTIEMFSAKPILRATVKILDSRIDEYDKTAREDPDLIPMLTQLKIELLNVRKTLTKLTEGNDSDGRIS